jgi:hypothetical protein
MTVFGSKDHFAIVVGQFAGHLRTVEIWVNGTNLTSNDALVYLPSFVYAMASTEHRLKKQLNFLKHEGLFLGLGVEEAFHRVASQEFPDAWAELRVFDWGPTTDDYLCFLLPVHGQLYLACKEHVSGSIRAVPIIPYEFARTMELAGHELSRTAPDA